MDFQNKIHFLSKSTNFFQNANDLNEKVTKQGSLVRDLKSSKAEKAKIDEAVKGLLALKAEFKAATGKDWAPGAVVSAPTPVQATQVGSKKSIYIFKFLT